MVSLDTFWTNLVHTNNTENDKNKQYIEQPKKVHRTTQKLGRVLAVPRLCGFYPGICLATEEKARKILSHGSHTYTYNKNIFFFFRWRYSPLWALACRTIPLHLSLSITNSLHLLTPNTWRSLSTTSHHTFLGLYLRLVPSSSWVKIFLGTLSSSILSR